MTRSAQCACGQLKVTTPAEPLKVSVCHCLECQRRTGSAFGVAVFFGTVEVTISGDSCTHIRGSESGFDVVHHFCHVCGSTVYWFPLRKPGTIAVALGCFGDPAFPVPHQQVYEHHRHAWVGLSF